MNYELLSTTTFCDKFNKLFANQVVVTILSGVKCKHENFCRPLEDYGPREDVMEERQVCRTTFEKDCQPVTVSDCMDVTELRCEVRKCC